VVSGVVVSIRSVARSVGLRVDSCGGAGRLSREEAGTLDAVTVG